MIDQVQRAHTLYSSEGAFRSAQLEVRLTTDQARELMSDFLTAARAQEDESAEKIVLTTFAHPPAKPD